MSAPETPVRRTPCKRCPIYREGPDPECEDIKGFVAQGLMPFDQAVYTCGWTLNRKCRGAFEFYSTPTPTRKEARG